MTDRIQGELDAARRELVRRRLRERAAGTVPAAPARAHTQERPVLSSAQQRIWFLDRLLPSGSAYHVPAAYRVRGPLDAAALDRALRTVVSRHEQLRTRFAEAHGRPYQIVDPVPERVLRQERLTTTEGRTTVEALCAEEAVAPFDLTAGPLLRARLVTVADDDHLFLVTVHHSVFDGWSAGVFVRELSEAYAAHLRGAEPRLPQLPLRYTDFAAEQQERLRTPAMERQAAYWRRQLEAVPALELPADRARPPAATYRGLHVDFEVPGPTVKRLRELAAASGTTPFVVTLAAFQGLLARHSGADDIVVGTPVSGRTRSELEPMIGFFVNTLALRTRLADDPPFSTLVNRLRDTVLDAHAHQDLPFEQVVDEVSASRDLSRNPIFQVWFGLLNQGSTGELDRLRLAGTEVTEVPLDETTTRFDLELHLYDPGEDRLSGKLIAARDLFDAGSAHRFVRHYLHLLDAAVEEPSLRLSRAPLADAGECDAALAAGIGPEQPFEAELTVGELFERQAAATPHATALISGETAMTYAELNERANRLAWLLRERGVGPETVVGLCLRRGPHMLIGLLAVVKAGGAYLPLDPGTPPERLRHILAEAGALLTVTQSELAKTVLAEEPVICLDTEHTTIGQRPAVNPPRTAGPGNLLYVIYTSGSTGRPKGVMMTHRPLLNLIAWQLRRTSAAGPTLQFSAINFDVSFQEMFTTWAAGERVVLPSEDQRRDPEQLLSLMARHGVRRLHCPPPVLEQLAAAAARTGGPLPPLREIVPAGEALRLGAVIRELAERLETPAIDNHYGPTEAHVVTAHRITGAPAGWPANPSIGTPIANVRVRLLDHQLVPVPPGLPGEVYLSGVCLSRGYFRQPGLTARAFLPDPFSDEPGARMYRTGDRARLRTDGTLEYLGRIDFQVKIRGYRIEPGEVEASLAELPGVRQAVVTVTEAGAGGLQLSAYATRMPGASPAPAELMKGLRQRLPGYMVPASVIVLDELPLTLSGKLDRARLPVPDQASRSGVAPRDEAERAIAEIWRRALKTEHIGAHDNFFELGGHSLAVPQVVHEVRQHFGVDLPLRTMFDRPVLADFATAAREAGATATGARTPVAFRGLTRPAPGRTQLFCLPFAGGTPQSFDAWLPEFRARYDVQVALLPGRGARFGEPMPRSAAEVVPDLAEEIRPHLGSSFVLFGHSMGALLAYELARELLRSHRISPACLVVSGQSSPQHRDPEGLHRLPPREMLRVLARFGGVDPGLFDQPELLDLVLPTLQADVAIAETYRHTPRPVLDCPVLVYGSADDPGTTPAALAGWRETTTGPVETVILPGGHFHFNTDPGAFTADLLRRLGERLPGEPR
ncbi:amino acid adenylation domain-containing protein [Streptomyces sp. NPDC052396]|uniref:amino acid adenylation domain-containing protein n=1 Tax=Streptomyces sp. NPDC052396 TaxID=3365689 RepID=UPI0037D7770A